MNKKAPSNDNIDVKNKVAALQQAVGQIEKQHGKGSIMRLGTASLAIDIPVIPSGSLALDIALGVGGFPNGRIVEIYGPESSGKTTLALHAIANAQKRGGIAVLIDAEYAFDAQYAKNLGVDIDNLLVSQPDTGEQALEIVDTLVRSGAIDIIVVDSVAALVPAAEIEGDMGESHMGLQARLMSQALRKLTGLLSKSKTCLIFINQLRMKIGVMFGNPETTTGGNALKFYASVRIDIRRIAAIKNGEETVGNRTRAKVVKNKVSPPFREAEFDILYGRGISFEADVLDLAVELEIVEKSGAWYSFKGERIGQGREKARDFLKENTDLLKDIERLVREKNASKRPQVTVNQVDDEEPPEDIDQYSRCPGAAGSGVNRQPDMNELMKSSKQIRNDFVEFFAGHGHRFVKSSPVVPQDDPTLLFTNAGMNQFKAIFLGDNPQKLTRAANSQKCMRVSGKHNDLEEVGRDHYHHTFFEMLGNWSFGDYYKKEAIRWGWELLTDVWKLPKDRLFVTIHTSDDEAETYWKSETDIEHHRIMRFGDKSNFWEMGETGPCGPCSEIHYDMGDAASRDATYADPVAGVNGENARYRELWNLVFMQYNREKDGTLKPLPSTHVDTGMGFERICSVIQGVTSNYDTDLFTPIIAEVARLSGKKYDSGVAGTPFRVIADHIRALIFAITDGAFPSNDGRGYVLRRLLRRAYRFGRELGFREPFLYKLVPIVIDVMGEAFPEIGQRRSYVEEVISSEEERFGATLEQGIEKFSVMIGNANITGKKVLGGSDVFALFDTFGFPMDLTRLMASEQGFTVDEAGYADLMQQQKTRARDARKNDDGLSPDGWTELRKIQGTEFVGYDKDSCEVNICRYKAIGEDGQKSELLIVLDRTPFYAESGGQVGDRGELRSQSGTVIRIDDTIKWTDLVVHRATIDAPVTKSLVQQAFTATVFSVQRSATRRNHSATHLLQAALRKALGDHVQQAGSKVEPAGLRFDFTHFKALADSELAAVERQVNEWIVADMPITTLVEDLETAKAAGATALFGEKYADKVRVVSMAPVSKELCGGTHAASTGSIGLFHITTETSISAGVRRIEAITGLNVAEYLARKEQLIVSCTSLLKVGETKLVERLVTLVETVRQLELQVRELSGAKSASAVEALFDEAKKGTGVFPWVVRNLGVIDKDTFTGLSDAVSDVIKNSQISSIAVVIGASVDGKALFAAGASPETVKKYGVHCGELVKAAAQMAGGGGGGSPTRAQAGGKDPAKIEEALSAVSAILSAKTAS